MRFLKLFIIIVLPCFPLHLIAETECNVHLATVLSTQGVVEKKGINDNNWELVKKDSPLCANETIRTRRQSRATVEIINQTIIRLNQNTVLSLPQKDEETTVYDRIINLLKGKIFLRSRKTHRLKVTTPFLNAVHQGTEFIVEVKPDQASILVLDGKVAANNKLGQVVVNKGQQAIASTGQAPQVKTIKISPQDAVQWLLYYPPILDNKVLKNEQPKTESSNFLVQKAANLLSLGQVYDAQKAINKANHLSPDNSDLLALEAIIAIAKNRLVDAFELASRAVMQDSKSIPAKIALSYTLQAQLKLLDAVKTMEIAVQQEPDHALAWARLAELQLSLGHHKKASTSAEKAKRLNPSLAHVQIVLGFSDLAQSDSKQAQKAFEQTIHLAPNEPLARLGLGLAKIRQGHVVEGTRNIETAVSLDPDNTIFRSYLGKAYYELKNTEYAETELAIGKEKDTKDPTPWFYDAILKQTTNRPVEALRNMQKAIELNDNRAVYRSNLLLDEDKAARSASLGRIYNDLGFQQRGLVEGWKSVNTSPSNFSAHRLLADNYSSLRKHETARVSELLQSQLLQPTNITPIQPRLAESNLLILDGLGPSTFSFNEYNPLFAKNRLALQASGLVGGNNTYSDEVVQSGLWNNFSYSLGQYHYKTDGYRPNNDLEQNIYSGFIQYQFTPNFSAQVEGRYNEFESGDLVTRFRPAIELDKRQQIETYSGRLGLHYTPAQGSHFLASLIYKNIDDIDDSEPMFESNEQSYTAEGQYLFESNKINLVIGGGQYQSDNKEVFDGNFSEQDENHTNTYIYSNAKLWKNLTATFGLSFDSYHSVGFKRNQLNPKLGLNWQILPSTLIRAAAFQTIKRPLSSNQTLEPTQISGFNQFFDDLNGSKTKRYGLAIDHKINSTLFSGFEASLREVEYPKQNAQSLVKLLTNREQLYRAYLLWTPFKSIALKASYDFERIKRNPDINSNEPIILNTHQFPVTFNYFHPNGFFTKWEATFVEQGVKYQRETLNPLQSGNNHFWIIDAAIGYRLPHRWGILSFGVKNLLDKQFDFEDVNTTTGGAVASQFLPDRLLFGQITLSF
ncbi:MAG: FecR domain-containing protein [Methylococcaceae bacterium]|nr:FecR domain-containing protein [Methylococcaceae bacterium]